MVGLVARDVRGDAKPKHRHPVVLVMLGRDMLRVGRGDDGLVPGGLKTPAQPVDVDLGAADAVGKIPAEQVHDLHARAVMCSNTRVHAATTSSQSASVNAAEIGSRINEAATRSVTGRSTAAMSGAWRAYGDECSGT